MCKELLMRDSGLFQETGKMKGEKIQWKRFKYRDQEYEEL